MLPGHGAGMQRADGPQRCTRPLDLQIFTWMVLLTHHRLEGESEEAAAKALFHGPYNLLHTAAKYMYPYRDAEETDIGTKRSRYGSASQVRMGSCVSSRCCCFALVPVFCASCFCNLGNGGRSWGWGGSGEPQESVLAVKQHFCG